MYPNPKIVSDLYPRIFTDPSIRRQLSKREEALSQTDYYNQISSSITFDELNKYLIRERAHIEVIFIYVYNIDKLGNLKFEYSMYSATLQKNGSIEYFLHDKFNIEQSRDGKYLQTYDNSRDEQTLEELKNIYRGKKYSFDLSTLYGILFNRRIDLKIPYQLLRTQYDKIKNDLNNYLIPFYLYLNQYDFTPKELARNLEINENYDHVDINDYIPDYENKIKEFDNENIKYIEKKDIMKRRRETINK